MSLCIRPTSRAAGKEGDALQLSHSARVIWNLLGKMDLSAFNKGRESVEGAAGQWACSAAIMRVPWYRGG
jgi:hypothetical protein